LISAFRQIVRVVRRPTVIALSFGLFGLGAAITLTISSVHGGLLNPGSMTAGHEDLACVSCHRPAPGSTRQQVQAIAAYLVGQRATSSFLALKAPGSSDCLTCHGRPKDRHPIHRFKEPRFLEALAKVDARTCFGCHREHSGARVANNGQFCEACHSNLILQKDPLDVPHKLLTEEKKWHTCLGCHDFHGARARKAPHALSKAIDATQIKSYLKDGIDPYSAIKLYSAKKALP
jgi:nitrate/TMAO reductase-like tetraheme cytochrome c subunit